MCWGPEGVEFKRSGNFEGKGGQMKVVSCEPSTFMEEQIVSLYIVQNIKQIHVTVSQ